MAMDDDPRSALAREDLCRYLSACYCEPDPFLAEDGVFDRMAAAAALLSPELAAAAEGLGEAFAAQDLQDLLVDYTRLFLGPPAPLAAPYGSVWLGAEPRVMGDSVPALQALYREAGFDVDEDLHEPPDHVALELEFLYLLTFRANDARRTGDGQELAAYERLRAAFLRDHLGAWGGRFAQAVQDRAGTAFYRGLGELTGRFLQLEREPPAG